MNASVGFVIQMLHLRVDDVAGFGSVKQAINYCDLCGAERSSADMVKRMPISKQRNKHLQSVLVEAAKLGPRLSPDLALVYDMEKQKGHANRATSQLPGSSLPICLRPTAAAESS